jgi:hypothetical protein
LARQQGRSFTVANAGKTASPVLLKVPHPSETGPAQAARFEHE